MYPMTSEAIADSNRNEERIDVAKNQSRVTKELVG
jgi:hypothetical protein